MSNDKSPYLGGTLTHLKDGRVMCCICFEYKHKVDLAVDEKDGFTYDVCKGVCAIQAGLKEKLYE